MHPPQPGLDYGTVFIFRVQRGPFAEEFYQCVTYGFYSAQWQEQLYTSFSLVSMFLLPLATLITTYILTFYTISAPASIEEGIHPEARSLLGGYTRFSGQGPMICKLMHPEWQRQVKTMALAFICSGQLAIGEAEDVIMLQGRRSRRSPRGTASLTPLAVI
ncbi:hypothetical protein HPB51_002231 [Rhipicephalus microplus]|uniref:Uncharacterized protein n=1 Tax=Rhipicephalus microplus TaxID=6941 RepID=A0A9J6EX35_RHIMP|nr:hypothetical protein HPB51_002231 [Rhipicephalus microplus]